MQIKQEEDCPNYCNTIFKQIYQKIVIGFSVLLKETTFIQQLKHTSGASSHSAIVL